VLERQTIFSQERTEIVRGQSGLNAPIDLAVVWPETKSTFMQGIKLAVDEINARGGVSLGTVGEPKTRHKILLKYYEQDPSWPFGTAQARVAQDRDNVAVIGHSNLDSALLASITYQTANLLYVAPTVSTDLAIRQKFSNVFQTTPENNIFAKK